MTLNEHLKAIVEHALALDAEALKAIIDNAHRDALDQSGLEDPLWQYWRIVAWVLQMRNILDGIDDPLALLKETSDDPLP